VSTFTALRGSVGALLALVAVLGHAEAQTYLPDWPQPWSPLTIHIVDKGVNDDKGADKVWDESAPMVRVDGTNNPRSIFGEASKDIVHITVQMPSDQEMKSIPVARLQEYVANQVRDQVTTLANGGARAFEIELIEHVNWKGYFNGSDHRQLKVVEFGKIAYGGISDAINGMRSHTTGIAVDLHLGSNGTFMFAKAIEGWGGIRDLIQRATMINGRAWWTEMKPAIGVLSADGSKVRIITSDHDYLAPKLSIANRVEESEMQKLFPKLAFLHVASPGGSLLSTVNPWDRHVHIATMLDGTAQFIVRDRDNKVLSKNATRAVLNPAVNFSDYQAAKGAVPVLGSPRNPLLLPQSPPSASAESPPGSGIKKGGVAMGNEHGRTRIDETGSVARNAEAATKALEPADDGAFYKRY
jgi:hypothetical protein